jgi:hypothetical protein
MKIGGIPLTAVGVLLVAGCGGSLASSRGPATGLIRTVPVQIQVTHPSPGENGGPVTGLTGGDTYTTSLDHAQAVAGYHILTFPASADALDSVRLHSPVTHSDGRPMSADQILKPSVELVYRYRATTISVIEDPVKPSPSLQFPVKDYGAANNHTANVDGTNVVYSGPDSSVDTIGFQTTEGLLVFMSCGKGGPLPLGDWGQLISQMG